MRRLLLWGVRGYEACILGVESLLWDILELRVCFLFCFVVYRVTLEVRRTYIICR